MATDRILMRVMRGGFQPADAHAEAELRGRNYRIGDLVSAEIRKPRNPKFHALAHALGAIVRENIEGFEGMGAHEVIKRLQLESGASCDELIVDYPGAGKCKVVTARSLSFESMDQAEFHGLMAALCRHVAEKYWPTMDPGKIEQMIGLVVD
ncbi:MAG: hypothetical protein KKC18_08080 [Chloroflexi bacterium]|nr:hypothetical protein [Chloroflexota bacterium]